MSLLGWPLFVSALVGAVLAPAACVVLWNRMKGWAALPARVSLLVLCQATAISAVGVGLNDHFQFFASWSDLTGRNNVDVPIQPVQRQDGPRALRRPLSGRLRRDFRPDAADGALRATLVGSRSGIRSTIWVWLPPQYRAQPRTRFPVIELLPGHPGTPTTWFHAMQGPRRLDEAMRTGAAQPYILVAPTITVLPGHDTECANVPHGPRVATWLAEDVRRIVAANFRALPGRGGWAAMGYSTGGFCAAELAVRYPRLFRAGVSLSGYFVPTTPALARLPGENLPTVVARRRPPVDLLLAASLQDPGTKAAVDGMVRAARPPTTIYTYVVPRGGHNTGVWTAMLPKCFQWLTTKLAHPA